jgi:hypothetical protein
LKVAYDVNARPVAYIARGAAEPLDPNGATLGGVQRSLARFEQSEGVGRSLELGMPDPIDLTSAGLTYAVRERGAGVRLRGPAGDSRVMLDPLAFAVGPDGTLAFVPRAAPRLLGAGIPPTLSVEGSRRVLWGAETVVTVHADAGSAPLPGLRVRVGAISGATDGAGSARLAVRLTSTGTLVAETVAPGPLAPAAAELDVEVRPQPSRLSGRIRRGSGGRSVVTGSVAGGARLPGRLGRVYVIDLASPGVGFLPGRELGSASGRGRFRISTRLLSDSRPALFFEGVTRRLSRP